MISGFHTPVEKDVLAILARRGANIIWVPARDLPKTLPKELKPVWEEQRLMILSPFDYCESRVSKATCSRRNRFILEFTSQHFLANVSENSALAADTKQRLL